MEKKTIQEVIVVEGRHDTEKLRKYFNCDTIETGGTSLGKEVLDLIRRAQKERGVIIFTDPDSAGNRIRNAVNRAVPGCKNAFVDRKDAHTTRKVGVEHAAYDPLLEALSHVMTYDEHPKTRLTMQDMYELGLSGRPDSSALREKAGAAFHIGNGTAKTMLNRLNCLGITKEQIEEVTAQ
jgi:ribonuclease M5